MAYNGYLIKLGGSAGTELPLRFITAASYITKPSQRIVGKSAQAVTGLTRRTVLEHMPVQIEFEAPKMQNSQLAELMALLRGAMSDESRKDITIQYYDMETDSYKVANCFLQDINYTIQRIDGNTIHYRPFKVVFVEY